MTPSPSPAAPAMQPSIRKKEPPSLFLKNPSRPFALAAMQAANGNRQSGSNGAKASQTAATPRPSPIPKVKAEPGAGLSSVSLARVKSLSMPEIKRSPSVVPTLPMSSSQGAIAAAEADVPYQEYRLVSCNRHGWRYDVMKFDARRTIDISTWEPPVKLNRKEIRREPTGSDAAGVATPTPVGPMLGPDGKPVIGADGRMVMVDAEGRPIHDGAAGSSSSSVKGVAMNAKDDKNKKKKFQKKTRQVFLVPEHVRQLRKEERYPWVMEDGTGSEVWEGRMEDATKSELHGLFMPAPDNVFRFVPAFRWYKFQKRRPQQQLWTLEEAEKMMAKMQKSKDQERWLMRQRNGTLAPVAGGLGGASLVHDYGGRSLAPGGRRLRTVDTGMRGLFDEDDEEGMQERKKRERERGEDGDLDEMEFEEDFADDEEKMEPEGAEDEEAKELEERLKREYRNANKTREGYIDESDEEEEADHLTGAGKAMKKLVRKIEKNAAYDSDEDKNPYASSEEEEDEEEKKEETPQRTGPAVQNQSNLRSTAQAIPQSKPGSRPTSKAPSQAPSRTGSPAPPLSGGIKIKSECIPLSPSLSSPVSPILGMGGHSIVAKRATSPKAPKFKSKTGSRASSPLAGGAISHATIPDAPGAASVAAAGSGLSKKRKAEDVATSATRGSGGLSVGAQPKPKRRKPTNAGAAGAPSGVNGTNGVSGGVTVEPGMRLSVELLVQWMKASPGKTTRECIHYFQPCLTDDAKKAEFTALVKEVATLKYTVLTLKAQYRDGE